MTVFAIDLSKSRTGWAHWKPGMDRPRYGHWALGSEITCDGQVFAKLVRCLSDHRKVMGIETLYYEAKINPAALNGHTTIHTLSLAAGLEAHVKSWCYAKGIRAQAINVESWRGAFIGRLEQADAKMRARRLRKAGDTRASARGELKSLTIERARQFGLSPENDDQADAIGILTYAIGLQGMQAPWETDEVLRPMLAGAAR